ncbi:MAG: bifunctional UDP-3-O-[3-hydroxymyristoyl] N-acetylglucosamine deacetylase/3-hydroxyacyl-ACP dehydratase [Bacteroidales bacterium]|nr:bifunctional UDP-3-O-[3-hydroxymyristoyl] N-acetylglucosamine deacetylase/3-hydroxyacyl-ACP dehydratase [Bacteroidales bacterium]
MIEKQKTIHKPISVKGLGLHSGKDVTLTFKPASENFGIKFKRVDVEDSMFIKADVDNVVDTSRGTTLEYHGVRVSTVEHVLSAIAGLGIDNILIELDSSETPILDGSSKYFVEALIKAGIVEQNVNKVYYKIKKNIRYFNPDNNIEILALPCDDFRVSVMIDFNSDVINTQFAVLDDIKDYKDNIAPCRTFVFLHELEYLINNNLIKGGDYNNAIVFVDKIISQEELDRLAVFFNKPKVEVLVQGILNNVELNFANEPARHKLLDVVGDLSLVGMPIKGQIIAKKPGHFSNVEFAKLIKNYIINEKKISNIPQYDLKEKPLYDINQIKNILPHRPPFLLVDKILKMSKTNVVGLKNVTMNEPFFIGHFPDEPIMPGVLQIEAMAQTGGILLLSQVPDPENYTTLFLKIDDVKFRKKVIPGDTVIFNLDLVEPIRRGICHMKGTAYVEYNVVMEATMLAQIVKNKK